MSERLYIKDLHIKKIRHLENCHISLPDGKFGHIILTGKNGAGKTSVLRTLKVVLLDYVDAFRSSDPSEITKKYSYLGINDFVKSFKKVTDGELDYTLNSPIEKKYYLLGEAVWNNRAILAYFPANRVFSSNKVDSIKPLTNIIENSGGRNAGYANNRRSMFLNYLVSLDYMKLSSHEDDDLQQYESISGWFDRFIGILKKIYNCDDLRLEKDKRQLDFYIQIPGRERFNFNQLSDGYAAIIDIIVELMMRFDYANMPYEGAGIVIIDEIETHLHVKLQKDVLPILTGLFPNLQFIISTHSPFVLSSSDDAIVYDLETQKSVEDMSLYSYQGIVETFFETSQYSDLAQEDFYRYKFLASRGPDTLTLSEKEELYKLIKLFRDLPDDASPEIKASFLSAELQRRYIENGKNTEE